MSECPIPLWRACCFCFLSCPLDVVVVEGVVWPLWPAVLVSSAVGIQNALSANENVSCILLKTSALKSYLDMKMYLFLSSQAVLRIYMLPPQLPLWSQSLLRKHVTILRTPLITILITYPLLGKAIGWTAGLHTTLPWFQQSRMLFPLLEALKTVHVQLASCRGIIHQHSDSLLTQHSTCANVWGHWVLLCP